MHGRKSRDRLKDPPGAANSTDLEQCPPNVLGAEFPRRGSNAGLEQDEKEKDREAKERRGGILGLRRISLLGAHKRHRSGAESSIAPNSPTDASFSGQLGGFSFPAEQVSTLAASCCDSQNSFWTQQSPTDPDLLPPIELSPPSPPRQNAKLVGTHSEPVVQVNASPSSAANVKFAITSQAASLGRNGTPTLEAQREIALRRNSLGDLKALDGGLKIPARISRAQVGLKRDLGLVKEFASCVERESHVTQPVDPFADDSTYRTETPAAGVPNAAERAAHPARVPCVADGGVFVLNAIVPSPPRATRTTA